jgi:hypothetical protein
MKKNKKYLLYIVVFFTIGFILNYFLDKRYDNLISKNTKKTIAIYDGYEVGYNSGPVSYFYFRSKNNNMELLDLYGKYNFLQKGDTVLIIYSKEDPSVGKVIDFCYMKKHKGKEYCNCLDE